MIKWGETLKSSFLNFFTLFFVWIGSELRARESPISMAFVMVWWVTCVRLWAENRGWQLENAEEKESQQQEDSWEVFSTQTKRTECKLPCRMYPEQEEISHHPLYTQRPTQSSFILKFAKTQKPHVFCSYEIMVILGVRI